MEYFLSIRHKVSISAKEPNCFRYLFVLFLNLDEVNTKIKENQTSKR